MGGNGTPITHGATYGNGVYVSKVASVSIGYARNGGRLLLCKCALPAEHTACLLSAGTDCASAQVRDQQQQTGGQGFAAGNAHDSVDVPEFAIVLRRASQVLPKYQVHFTTRAA